MNIDLKLKDCILVEISSELDIETHYDYYGENPRPTENITFYFDDDVRAEFNNIGEDCGTFCYLANFFYMKDFSKYTRDDFLEAFSNHVEREVRLYKPFWQQGDIAAIYGTANTDIPIKIVSISHENINNSGNAACNYSGELNIKNFIFKNNVCNDRLGRTIRTIKKLKMDEFYEIASKIIHSEEFDENKKSNILGEFYEQVKEDGLF